MVGWGACLWGFFVVVFGYLTTRGAQRGRRSETSAGLKLLAMFAVPWLVFCAALLAGRPLLALGAFVAMMVLRWIIRW